MVWMASASISSSMSGSISHGQQQQQQQQQQHEQQQHEQHELQQQRNGHGHSRRGGNGDPRTRTRTHLTGVGSGGSDTADARWPRATSPAPAESAHGVACLAGRGVCTCWDTLAVGNAGGPPPVGRPNRRCGHSPYTRATDASGVLVLYGRNALARLMRLAL